MARFRDRRGQASVEHRLVELRVSHQVHVVHEPVVQRPVVFELQRTKRMGNAFQGIAQGVRVVVHRVDRPGVSGVLVLDVLDPVDGWVAQVDVAAGHVDLGA